MVRVRQLVAGTADAFGNASRSYGEPTEVPGAWFSPTGTSDAIEDGRPDGLASTVNVYVPKERPAIEWRGALVALDGESFEWRVVGDPMPYPAAMTPGAYNLVVGVRRSDG